VSDVISEVLFWPFWLMLPGLGPNRLAKVFHRLAKYLKFSLETRPRSESFEPLINFLAFLVQKL